LAGKGLCPKGENLWTTNSWCLTCLTVSEGFEGFWCLDFLLHCYIMSHGFG
jgi:hypothetical protein